ncbi:TPA: hypothetical protein ACTOBE_001469, partial [Campylobacter jejuni]
MQLLGNGIKELEIVIKSIITPAYIDAFTNEYCITYSKALYKDGKFIGVLGIDVLLTSLQDQIARTPGNTFAFD